MEKIVKRLKQLSHKDYVEIAKMADVSYSTVRRFVNETHKVSHEKRYKIRRAALEYISTHWKSMPKTKTEAKTPYTYQETIIRDQANKTIIWVLAVAWVMVVSILAYTVMT